MRIYFLTLIYLGCFFPLEALAQEWKTAPVVVSGDQQSPQVHRGSDTTIRVENYGERSMGVVEVLKSQPGVHLNRLGGLEDSTSISIRGSSGDEVVFILDGIPLSSSTGMNFDLSPIFLESLDQIDIYRNGAPFSLGGEAAGGVVSLHSKPLKRGVEASLSYGSFNTLKTQGSFSHQWKPGFEALVSFSYGRTDGDFNFLDDNGTPFNTNDDAIRRRVNNQSQTFHPFLKLGYDFDKNTRIDWVLHHVRKENGVPGLATNQASSAQLTHGEWLSDLKIRRDHFLNPHLSLENHVYLREAKSQFQDLSAELGLGGAQDTDDDLLVLGDRMLGEFFWGKHQIVSLIFNPQFEGYSPENFLSNPSVTSSSKRQTLNWGLSHEVNLWDERLEIQTHFLQENLLNRLRDNDPSFSNATGAVNDTSFHDVSGGIKASLELPAHLKIHSSFSRSFRHPYFEELFGDRGNVVGNPFLKPQKALHWDGGLSYLTEIFEGGVIFFDRRLDDLIQYEQNAGFARAENVGRAKLWGLETQMSLELFHHVRWSANYTFQKARDESGPQVRNLVGRPQHEIHSQWEGKIKKWGGFVNLDWLDKMYLNSLNTQVISQRLILGSGLTYSPSSHWKISFEGKNLTDDQIVDTVGFPLPGRSFFGKLAFNSY